MQYIFIHYPPPCRRHRCVLNPTPKAPVTISNHPIHPAPVTISNHPIHRVPFAVGVWRCSWSRSLQFQSESESGVSSLEICRGGPPPYLRASESAPTPQRLPIPLSSRLFRVCRSISSSCYVISPPRYPNIAQDSPKSFILEPTSSKTTPK